MEPELKFEGKNIEGGELYLTFSSDDRERLVSRIRTVARDFVNNADNNLGNWANSGVEKAGSPIAFDPENKGNMALEAKDPSTKTKWNYKQTVRLTKMI